MQHCDSTCHHCARDWFKWLKGREAQMRNAKKGETTSFAVAASTSVRPERGSARPVGAAVTVESLSYPHTAEVLYDSGRVGLDGRHWVKVAVRTGSGPAWGVHVEATDLL